MLEGLVAKLMAVADGQLVATAESCTGGMIAAAITDLPGSSRLLDRGFVTYSNAAKSEMLGVPPDLITHFGAVSAEVAEAMARGAVAHSKAQAAVAVTGIAGPGGATAGKPVGLVYIASFVEGQSEATISKNHLGGDRSDVRRATAELALEQLIVALQE